MSGNRAMPLELFLAASGYPSKSKKKRKRTGPRTMEEIKLAAVREALSDFGDHRGKAAARLKISEASLYRILKRAKAKAESSNLEEKQCI